jgi:hypothetical protein
VEQRPGTFPLFGACRFNGSLLPAYKMKIPANFFSHRASAPIGNLPR